MENVDMKKKRYPGVVPFTVDQNDIFFGRTKDIQNLVDLILLRKQILLYAKSGVGKTSLIDAGVMPEMSQKFPSEYHFIKIRFNVYPSIGNQSPVQIVVNELEKMEFAQILPTNLLFDKLFDDNNVERGFWQIIQQIQLFDNNNATYILVFDQFEELFTYPNAQINEFKEQLFQILQTEIPNNILDLISKKFTPDEKKEFYTLIENPRIKIVYAIRSDRIDYLNRLTDKIANIQRYFYELKPLNIENAKKAITGPALVDDDKDDIKFESPRFNFNEPSIEKIISKLKSNSNSQNDEIESTQLQIVCQAIEEKLLETKLDHNKSGKQTHKEIITLTESDIPEFKDIFKSYYQNYIKKLPWNERSKTKIFIENETIRDNHRISLDAYYCQGKISKESLEILVTKAHILKRVKNSLDHDSYELGHDVLIEPILEVKSEKYAKMRKLYWQIGLAITLIIVVILIGLNIKNTNERDSKEKKLEAKNDTIQQQSKLSIDLVNFMLLENYINQKDTLKRDSIIRVIILNIENRKLNEAKNILDSLNRMQGKFNSDSISAFNSLIDEAKNFETDEDTWLEALKKYESAIRMDVPIKQVAIESNENLQNKIKSRVKQYEEYAEKYVAFGNSFKHAALDCFIKRGLKLDPNNTKLKELEKRANSQNP